MELNCMLAAKMHLAGVSPHFLNSFPWRVARRQQASSDCPCQFVGDPIHDLGGCRRPAAPPSIGQWPSIRKRFVDSSKDVDLVGLSGICHTALNSHPGQEMAQKQRERQNTVDNLIPGFRFPLSIKHLKIQRKVEPFTVDFNRPMPGWK